MTTLCKGNCIKMWCYWEFGDGKTSHIKQHYNVKKHPCIIDVVDISHYLLPLHSSCTYAKYKKTCLVFFFFFHNHFQIMSFFNDVL
jgi:hypothetical protein